MESHQPRQRIDSCLSGIFLAYVMMITFAQGQAELDAGAGCADSPLMSPAHCQLLRFACDTVGELGDATRSACASACGVCLDDGDVPGKPPLGGSSHIELRVGCVDVAGGVCSRGPPLVLERWTDQQGRVVLEGEDTDAPSVLVKYQLVLAQPDADCAEHARLAHQLASESQVHAALLGSRCVVEAREAYVGAGVLVVEGVHMTDAPETEPPTTPPPRPWIVGPSRRMGMRQLATLAQHYHETMAVVVSHSSAGAHEDHVGMVEEEARLAGMRVVANVSLAEERAAYPALLQRLHTLDPEALVLFTSDEEACGLLRSMRAALVHFRLVYVHDLVQAQARCPDLLEFVVSVRLWQRENNGPSQTFGTISNFVQMFESRVKAPPTETDAMATASLELVLQAVQLSRSVDQAMVRAALLFLQLDSVFGPVRFSLEGDNAGTEPLVVQNEQDVHRIIFPHSSANTSSLGEFVRWECRHLLQDEDKSVCDEDERDWYRQCTSEYPAVQTRFDASQCSESGDSGAASGFLFLLLLLPLLLAMCACRQYEQRKRERVMFVRERDVVVETDDDQQPIVYGQSSMGQVHGGRYRNRQVALKPLFPLPVASSGGDVEQGQGAAEAELNQTPTSVQESHLSVDGGNNSSFHRQARQLESTMISQTAYNSILRGETRNLARLPSHTSQASHPFTRSLWQRLLDLLRYANVLEMVPYPLNSKQYKILKKEAINLVRIEHVNLVKTYGVRRLNRGRHMQLVVERMDLGALHDILLYNNSLVSEHASRLMVLLQVTRGLVHLHESDPPILHCNLKAANVFVDHMLVAKLSDFGLSNKRWVHGHTTHPLRLAPEQIFAEETHTPATDVFSLGYLMWEVFTGASPAQHLLYKCAHAERGGGADVDLQNPTLESVANVVTRVLTQVKQHGLRPSIPETMPKPLKALMEECWMENPARRPAAREVLERLVNMHQEWSEETERDNRGAQNLLAHMLPPKVASLLKRGLRVDPESFDPVTIFFSEIVGFNEIVAVSPPEKVVLLLSSLYSMFDQLVTKHGIFKVETIGDTFFAVGGIPEYQEDHTLRIARFAVDACAAAGTLPVDKNDPSKGFVAIRVGFHVGPVVANVLGTLNRRYCLFGDTVNTASRMKSYSLANHINMSSRAAMCLKQQCSGVALTSRGMMKVKGKGDMECFFLDRSPHNDVILGLASLDEEALFRENFSPLTRCASDQSLPMSNDSRSPRVSLGPVVPTRNLAGDLLVGSSMSPSVMNSSPRVRAASRSVPKSLQNLEQFEKLVENSPFRGHGKFPTREVEVEQLELLEEDLDRVHIVVKQKSPLAAVPAVNGGEPSNQAPHHEFDHQSGRHRGLRGLQTTLRSMITGSSQHQPFPAAYRSRMRSDGHQTVAEATANTTTATANTTTTTAATTPELQKPKSRRRTRSATEHGSDAIALRLVRPSLPTSTMMQGDMRRNVLNLVYEPPLASTQAHPSRPGRAVSSRLRPNDEDEGAGAVSKTAHRHGDGISAADPSANPWGAEGSRRRHQMSRARSSHAAIRG